MGRITVDPCAGSTGMATGRFMCWMSGWRAALWNSMPPRLLLLLRPCRALDDRARVAVVISGTVTDRLAPAVAAIVDGCEQQAGRRPTVISFGACASSGGPYWDSYAVTKGIDQLLAVDAFTCRAARLHPRHCRLCSIRSPGRCRRDRDSTRGLAGRSRGAEGGRARLFRLAWLRRRDRAAGLPSGGSGGTESVSEAEPRMLSCSLSRTHPRIDSISGVFAGAAWHEREAAELFGVEFIGGERRRLLLNPEFEGTPLRKDEVLAARTGMNWPGAKEPGKPISPLAADDWCLPEFPTRSSGVIAMRRSPRQFPRRLRSLPPAVGSAGGARDSADSSHRWIRLIEPACTSCMICARECPTWCISIDSHTEAVEGLPPGRGTVPSMCSTASPSTGRSACTAASASRNVRSTPSSGSVR